MKIVIAVSSAAYWGPQAEQLAVAMRGHGHDVRTVEEQAVAGGCAPECDLLFCLTTHQSLAAFLAAIPARHRVMYLLESIPTLTETDDFTAGKLNVHKPYLHRFDFIFVHTRRSIPMLQSLGIQRVEELLWPHFPTIYFPANAVAQDFDLLFLGTPSPHRNQFIKRLGSKYKLVNGNGVFHQQAGQLFARAKIVLNIHFTPLANFECRVAEVLGCGGFLLTEALEPGDLLKDREHLVVFDEQNVINLVEHYLCADDERGRIAAAGHAAIQRFTVANQVERILRVAEALR